MHDTVLMILSVRNIQSIIDCYNNLNCEKIWFKGFPEYELVTHINNFIQNSNFQYYFIVSDDVYIHYDKFEELKLQLSKSQLTVNLNTSKIQKLERLHVIDAIEGKPATLAEKIRSLKDPNLTLIIIKSK